MDNVEIPVRCFSCNKVIGDKVNVILKNINEGNSMEICLNKAGLTRYCCRRMILGTLSSPE